MVRSLPPPPPIPVSSRRLSRGRVELLEIAGTGGMSTVWRAMLHGSGGFRRPVAVKHMFPHLAAQKMYRDMFFEEARIGALLEDPNIPQIYEYMVTGKDHYIILEFIEGINLATLIRYHASIGRSLPWELVAAVGIGVLRGLTAAHERFTEDGKPCPIIHRDVSPHNIMISAKGPAKLIDFGLSFSPDRRCGDTDPGHAKGKLPYLSPEILKGARPSRASDQFAGGTVLWEALVGRRLFDDTADRAEAFRKLMRAEVPPVRNERRDVPPAFAALIERALSLDVHKRFSSVREMAKLLGDVLKSSISREDLYATLARAVSKARDDLAMGHRTQTTVDATIQEVESGLVELIA